MAEQANQYPEATEHDQDPAQGEKNNKKDGKDKREHAKKDKKDNVAKKDKKSGGWLQSS